MDGPWTTHLLDAGLGRDTLLGREWLLTNGTGSYAMGTALGANTRRYHGLLVAATHPPVGRVVTLNQTIDQLHLQLPNPDPDATEPIQQRVELSSALFPGGDGLVHAPEGFQTLRRFEKGLSVTWTYRWGPITVSRELVLHWKQPAITLRYRVAGLEAKHGRASLTVAPLLTLRDFHGLQHRDDVPSFKIDVEAGDHQLTVEHGPNVVTMDCPAGTFETDPDWWFNLAYPRDTYRGQGDREDAFTPGRFLVPLTPGEPNNFTITAALGDEAVPPQDTLPRAEHLKTIWPHLPGPELQKKALAIAADDFVVDRKLGSETLATILAGYPWFADWGRDTFIALPGLLLCTGQLDDARAVLRAFAGSIKDGLVPNRFDDYDESIAHYNTVDGPLWFVHAALAYLDQPDTDDDRPWLLDAVQQVVDAFRDGTHAESHAGEPVPIFMDDDGLIVAGNAESQLTWMDAACGDVVFTPRFGKCVEINALWHSALVGLSDKLADSDEKPSKAYAKLARKVKRSFKDVFWSERLQRLIDHVTPEGFVDWSMRPNQIFAVSLERGPLPVALRKAVVDAVGDALLTPVGLRTLPPDDPNYHPHYAGPQFERDKSYHQGTVWPWLMGPYVEAVLRAGKFTQKARTEARLLTDPLLDLLLGEGLGQLHEIHDADPDPGHPTHHAPRGCPAQAWSVAELVRVLQLIELC